MVRESAIDINRESIMTPTAKHPGSPLPPLPYRLDRTVTIKAPRATVFRFFTDSARWAAWWGAGSEIDAQPGGRVYIRYPNGIEAGGEVLAMEPDARLAFSFGFASGDPMPMGASRVTITLESVASGTRVTLTHELADETVRDQHVQGWRYQLSLFGNVVSDEVNASAAEAIDQWFALWTEPDAAARESTIRAIASTDIKFHDRFSLLAGVDDLVEHIGASQRFMPGVVLARAGNVRHCQGMVLSDWTATAGDRAMGAGTNVFVHDADGRIERVTGFWNA